MEKMKGSSGVVASVIALSTVALSSSSSVPHHHCPFSSTQESESRKTNGSDHTDKFAPRFDGLRFIETLVTAHR